MKTMTYETALKQLEAIVSQIESGSLDVDQLAAKLKEAKKLIDFCQSVLTKVRQDVEMVLGEE